MSDELRPTAWSEYIGQERMKSELQIRIDAARKSNRPLEPILLAGPAGSGKTSLGQIIAAEMNEPFDSLILPVTPRALFDALTRFEGVMLLEELHGMSRAHQELLLPLLEFGHLQGADGQRIETGYLCIIATTTNPQNLIEPLYDRFPVRPDYDEYTADEMARIVLGMASKAGVGFMDHEAARLFGVAACGTPRRARQFVLGYRDLYLSKDRPPTPDEVFYFLRVANDGLTRDHIRYLETLDALGGQKGVKIIASLLRMSESIVTDLERLLLKKKLIEYGDKGRALTRDGRLRARGEEMRPRRDHERKNAA